MDASDDLTLIDLPHGVTTIDVAFQRPGMAASHLVVDEGRAGFIDVGTSHSTPLLLRVLAEKGLDREDVDYVMVTHVHLDHAGGAGTLMRELPSAKLVVHPRGARHMIEPSKLIAGATAVYGEEEVARSYGEIAPVPAERVVEAPEGTELRLGHRTLRFLDTPGHARHHYAVVDETARGVFTGDCFGLSYRDLDTDEGPWIFPTTTPVQFDPEAMHATIDRIAELGLDYVYLTHFSRLGDVQKLAGDMHRRLDRVVEIAHRVGGDGAERHASLVGELRSFYIDELRAHGSTLADTEIDRVLGIDIELNAQGIEFWLDHDVKSGR